jgi:predicted DNA-binding transcriptional regulator
LLEFWAFKYKKEINKKVKEWSLITNHGLVLAAISRNSKKTIRQIGDDVGITERTAYGIVVDLEKAGYIKRTKVGTRNMYTINPDMPFMSRLSDASVGDMLALFGWQHLKATKRHKPSKEVNV